MLGVIAGNPEVTWLGDTLRFGMRRKTIQNNEPKLPADHYIENNKRTVLANMCAMFALVLHHVAPDI